MNRPTLFLATLFLAHAAVTARAQTFVRQIPDLPVLYGTSDVAVDSGGNLWITTFGLGLVKVSPSGQELLRLRGQFRVGIGPNTIGAVTAIVTSSFDEVYVGSGNYVLCLDGNGSLIRWFGGGGSGPGQFGSLVGGLALASNGSLYAVDVTNQRIERFDQDGNFLGEFGSAGSGAGQFDFYSTSGTSEFPPFAVGVAIDAAGNVYVLDPGNNRVQKFDAAGQWLASYAVAPFGNFANAMNDLIVADSGQIIVTRYSSSPALQMLDSLGSSIRQITSLSHEGSTDSILSGLCVSNSGRLLVCGFNRVFELDSNWSVVNRYGNGFATTVDGRFNRVGGVAIDVGGDLLVSDASPRLQRFDSSGSFQGRFLGSPSFSGPCALDPGGNIYLADGQHLRKYSSAGVLLQTIGSLGTGPGQFNLLRGIAVDRSGYVYTADSNLNRIQKFNPAGGFVLQFGGLGTGGLAAPDGMFSNPAGVAVGPNDDVWVADSGNSRVQHFDGSGNFLEKFANSQPFALTLDDQGRIFVGSTGAVQIYGPLLNRVGTLTIQGLGPGELLDVTALAVRGGVLAIGESNGNRVQLFDVTSLDNQIPVVAITAPAQAAWTTSTTLSVQGTVTDASPTSAQSTNVVSGFYKELPAGGGSFTGNVEIVAGLDGIRTIGVTARDTHGNAASTLVSVALDRTAPVLNVFSPAEGARFSTSAITVGLTASDLTATTVTISHGGGVRALIDSNGDGFFYALPTTPTNGTFPIQLVDGPNAIVVEATDAAGHTTRVTRNVICDLSAPVVTFVSPLDGDFFGPGSSPIPVSVRVDDWSAISITSQPTGVSGTIAAGNGNRIVNGAVTLAAEGSNTIRVTAQESVAPFRTGFAEVTVIRDTTAPTVAIDAPAAASLVRGILDVSATAADATPGSGIYAVDFTFDGNPIGTDDSEPFELQFDSTTVADGGHTIGVTATDRMGNATSTSVAIAVDNTAPSLLLTGPASGAVVGGSALAFTADAADAGSGLGSVTMKVGNGAPSTDGSASFATPAASAAATSFEDTTRWPDGPLLLTVSAVDAAGNTATRSVTVVVDNSAPAGVRLVSPTAGSSVSGIVALVAQAADSNLASLKIFVDGLEVGSTTASTLTVNYNAAARTGGSMTIEVVATDVVGNRAAASAIVNIANMKFRFEPESLSLKAKGAGIVTAKLKGPSVAALLPVTAHVIELRVPGGNPVFAKSASGVGKPERHDDDDDDDCDRDHSKDLELSIRFDRATFIASVRAAMLAGLLPVNGVINVSLVVDGAVVGSAKLRVTTKSSDDDDRHDR